MALIKKFQEKTPRIGKDCYLSENATIIGDCSLGDDCSVWFNAVIRADINFIHIGQRCNIQDGACVHVSRGDGSVTIGNDVSIGHNATVHACTIHDGALIGMGATVLDGAEVGEGAIVAAGAVVLQHTKIGAHEIWGGVPAKFIKMAQPHQAEDYAKAYMEVKPYYM
jgi:carbonic anhydrase/acetyltransferase-like protein (isoleucine patch superfamily)